MYRPKPAVKIQCAATFSRRVLPPIILVPAFESIAAPPTTNIATAFTKTTSKSASLLQSRAGCHMNDMPNPISVSGMLVTRLQRQCSIENAKILASAVGYNDSPIFGAKKKKAKLVAELVMAEVALIVHAVNQVFDEGEAKSVLDPFLARAAETVFTPIKNTYAKFDDDYSLRMEEYYSVLVEPKPGIAMSFAFIKNLGINPIKVLHGQLLVSVHFGKSISDSIDAIGAMKRIFDSPAKAQLHGIDLEKAGAVLERWKQKAEQRKKAQKNVDDTTKLLRGLIDSSVNGILRMKWADKFSPHAGKLITTFHNPAAEKLLGVDSVALTNCDDVSLAAHATVGTSTEIPLELSDKLRATAEKKECVDLEVMRTDAGKEVWLRLIAEPIGESGEVAVTLVDITQRKAELMEAIEAGVASKEFDPGRKFDNLFKLKKLLDEGIITEEEYEVERKKLLK